MSGGTQRQAQRRLLPVLRWWPIGVTRAPLRRSTAPRVAYFHHCFPLPSETFIQREVRALQGRRLNLQVFSLSSPRREDLDAPAQALAATTRYLEPITPLRRSVRDNGLVWRRLPTATRLALYAVLTQHTPRKLWRDDQRVLRRAMTLAQAAHAWGATHLHSPWASPDATVTLLAASLLGLPYTVHARASDLYRTSGHHGLRDRLRYASAIVTNSDFNRHHIRELLGADSIRVPVLRMYNGLDISEYRPQSAGGEPAPTPLLLSVGRFVEFKGFEHLLQACALLQAKGRRLRCEIIGAPPPEAEAYGRRLHDLRQSLALEDVVTFLGAAHPTQVRERYAAASIFVLPSVMAADGTSDVTPNVVLEAMASGRPVIATKIRAIPELIDDGVHGLLVAPGDAPALAAAIERVLDHADVAERMGRAARQRVEERFDIARNIDTMLRLFHGELTIG